ncbi:hypothetical protein YDYSY3_38640 [Paenibacillus chitinolyticus]|nr:hypothetical protein YDYSY3_38640 [Paenibacillus chitinolyticus]
MNVKRKIYPTCRLCEKLNTFETHCAIYGAIEPESINNTAIGAACLKSGDYVRSLHAIPNEYNYRLGENKTDEIADEALLIFDAKNENEGFKNKHGMSLEEWAQQTFGEKGEQ